MLGPMGSAARLPPKRITSALKWIPSSKVGARDFRIPFFETEPGRNGAFVKHLGATGRSMSAITGSSVTMIARAVERRA
jgi:hypothetical protein